MIGMTRARATAVIEMAVADRPYVSLVNPQTKVRNLVTTPRLPSIAGKGTRAIATTSVRYDV